MAEGAILEPPEEVIDAEVVSEETVPEEQQEVPSVFSITNRHLVGRLAVTPPAEDGSRTMQLFSANGGTIVELNLSAQLCQFAALKLIEVEVIPEDGAEAEQTEEAPDAGPETD